MNEWVVLVDRSDEAVGVSDKLDAHISGTLHRAFSICIFDPAGRVLLQRRAGSKYHSAGLWSNSCCSHPRPGEATASAAHRRLIEELGFDCALQPAFTFIYHADVGGGLTEHEYDHVFTGVFDGRLGPDPEEVEECRWVRPAALLHELEQHPARFTPWSIIAFDELRRRGYLDPRSGVRVDPPRGSDHVHRQLQSRHR
jgi:isopentenyl-diphosphate Delta-isomerase